MSRPNWVDGARWSEAAGALDVWRVPLGEPRDRACLSEDERSRAAAQSESRRREFERSRAALRCILGRALGVDAAALRLEKGPHGKPQLESAARPLDFSLAHSGDWALLAVAPRARVGVDLERERDGREWLGIARRFFAAEEAREIEACTDAERRAAFYRRWVCKEAYLKAWGTGLQFSPRRFRVAADADPPQLLQTEMPDDDPQCWRFVRVEVDSTHRGAVCWNSGPLALRLWTLA